MGTRISLPVHDSKPKKRLGTTDKCSTFLKEISVRTQKTTFNSSSNKIFHFHQSHLLNHLRLIKLLKVPMLPRLLMKLKSTGFTYIKCDIFQELFQISTSNK